MIDEVISHLVREILHDGPPVIYKCHGKTTESDINHNTLTSIIDSACMKCNNNLQVQ